MTNAATAARGATQEAIQFHYDVGNEFYSLWLDRTMTYSCALWYADEDLHTAQLNKIDWHLKHAGVKAGDRLLDIGCGWGAMMQRAIGELGIEHAVGLSLSAEQVSAINAAAIPKLEVRLETWLEHKPEQPYNAMVSVGAFEHFARLEQSQEDKMAGYKRFFEFCHQNLVPGGRLSLQTITYENFKREDFSPFFAEHIFPESDLPRLEEIVAASAGLFEVEVVRNDRHHYARTMRCWLADLRANREKAISLVGKEKVATYEKYLALMVVAFHTGTMNLARLGLRRVTAR